MLCRCAECHYGECRVLFTVMLNVTMLSVVMQNVVMLSVIILSVVAPLAKLRAVVSIPCPAVPIFKTSKNYEKAHFSRLMRQPANIRLGWKIKLFCQKCTKF